MIAAALICSLLCTVLHELIVLAVACRCLGDYSRRLGLIELTVFESSLRHSSQRPLVIRTFESTDYRDRRLECINDNVWGPPLYLPGRQLGWYSYAPEAAFNSERYLHVN